MAGKPMQQPMYAGPAGGAPFAVHMVAQEKQTRTGLRWKQLCTMVAAVGLIIAITAMGTMLLMQRADATPTTPPEDDEETIQSPCNVPARPAFASLFDSPTAFFTKGMVSRLHLQGVALADNQQGQQHMQLRTTCAIRERLVSGGTRPLDNPWQCRVECFGSECSVSHVGDAPLRGGLFEVSVTATRADCTAPIRDVDRAIMDVYVEPTTKPRTCPPGVAKSEPGICGCATSDTDRDGDGVADCVDYCPDDASKSALGVCGCGVADTDTDADGSPDCEDGCPLDVAKTVPGACGCGVADTDADGDGIMDCHDACPLDAMKIVPGACGCGIRDTDIDNDGVMDCNDPCTLPGECSVFTSDLQATPAAVEAGMKAVLNVDIRPNHGAACSWSIPSSWTLQGTPSCSSAVVSVPASATASGAVTIVATATTGESWQATVMVPLAPSTNAAPSAPDVSITPEHPESGDVLHCTAAGSVDPDGDSVNYIMEWLRNGEPSGILGTYVIPAATQPGELWTCQVQATDGQHRSAPSAARVVIVRKVIAGPTIRQDEEHKVPDGVSKVAIKLWGGGGGGSFAESIRSHGGAGGLTVGTIPVVPGDVIRMRIGEGGYMYDHFYDSVGNGLMPGGYPGGGINSERPAYFSGGGGGYSAVWLNDKLMMVAGGGGGAAGTGWGCPGLHGGAGGGEIGQRGYHCPGRTRAEHAGGGGSQVAGGAGGGNSGEAGSKFQGGNGGKFDENGHVDSYGSENAAGGGGGGYYGGGSGSVHTGGGGGSSFVDKSVVQDYEMLQAAGATNAPRSTTDSDLNGVSYVGYGAYAGAGGDGVGIVRFM